MLASFPEAAKIGVPRALASELVEAAQALPLYDNRQFYSYALQESVHDRVREASLDGFDWLVNQTKERLAVYPYCAMVQGLSFDEGNRLFVAINRAFGRLEALPYQEPRAQLVHYLQPATDIHSARGGREAERLHTDAVDWQTPIQLISMACIRPDRNGGGRSRILDIDAIRDEVKTKLGAEMLELLETTDVPWQLHTFWGGGVKWRPVLSQSAICWRRYTIDLALDVNGATLSAEILDALDAFEEILGACSRTIDFMLDRGDLLFSDNLRTIHARTAIAAEDASDRLMIRSWINT